jgi:hypothetical protein
LASAPCFRLPAARRSPIRSLSCEVIRRNQARPAAWTWVNNWPSFSRSGGLTR